MSNVLQRTVSSPVELGGYSSRSSSRVNGNTAPAATARPRGGGRPPALA